MIKLFLCCLFGGFLIICFSQDVATNNPVVLLQQYRAAERIYQQAERMSPHKVDTGMHSRTRQLYDEALTAFERLIIPTREVGYDSLLFCVYLSAGNIYSKLEKTEDALSWYKEAEDIPNSYNYFLDENLKYYNQLRSVSVPHGLLFKQAGDELVKAGRKYEAIQQYNKAIQQYDSTFTTTDIYSNPTKFTVGLPFQYLYPVLIAKGDAFTQLRPGTKNIKALNAAANAYHAALELAEFVMNSDSLGRLRWLPDAVTKALDNRPIKVYRELYELTGQKHYQEEAYLFEQRIKLVRLFVNDSTPQKRNLAIPSIASLQQLIDKRTAILSYAITKEELSIFVITRNEINYHTEPLHQEDFSWEIFNYMRFVFGDTVVKRHDPTLPARLYQKLVSPIHSKLKGIRRLIIIPDYSMNNVTFEALQKNNKTYLLEEFAVQYQYSTAFLGRNVQASGKPTQSYTASYQGSPKDFISYTDSIRQLKLDSAQVVFFTASNLSAYQIKTAFTVSKAFASAGCPNMILSLWVSNDSASAFVKTRLQEYLDEGYSRDKALQLARLDLLRNSDMDARHKTPDNWANMVLVGEYEPPYHPTPWIMIAIIASVIAAVVWVVTVKSNY